MRRTWVVILKHINVCASDVSNVVTMTVLV